MPMVVILLVILFISSERLSGSNVVTVTSSWSKISGFYLLNPNFGVGGTPNTQNLE